MALLFMDGFQAGDFDTKYSAVGGSPVRQTSGPPVVGGAYLELGTGDSVDRSFAASSEIFGHVRYKHTGGSKVGFVGLFGDGGTTQHLSFYISASNVLEVRRGTATSGTILGTGATSLATGWHDIQFRATIADAGGVFQARIAGLGTNEINFSGDTKNGGTNTTIDKLVLEEITSNVGFTDLVICNTTGSYNNTWTGEVTVRTLTPDGNGNTSQMVGSDANSTDNYLLVDELPLSTADYVGSATSGQGDTYTMTDLPGSPTVYAVQVNAHIVKTDAGVVAGKIRVRSGGTTYASGSKTPLVTYATVSEIYETDPATAAAWTYTNVNAMEAGIEVA